MQIVMIEKNKQMIISIAFCILSINTLSQEVFQKYVIITFEDIYNVAKYEKKNYYWIVSQDSIISYNIVLSHLFIGGFSKTNLDDCRMGVFFDPYIITQNTNYNFDSIFYCNLTKLENILNKKKKKLQQIKKKWSTGKKEIITIFATPIIGIFCSSDYHILGQQRYGYNKKIYLPVSSFLYSEEFWKSDKAKFILKYDLSKLNFSIIP